MKAYIICFTFTILFTYFSECYLKRNKKSLGKFLLLISLLIPCYISGMRSEIVGKDVRVYFLVLFNVYTSGHSFIEGMQICNTEFGYSLFMYITSKFNNMNFCMFVNQLLVCLPIYLLAYRIRKDNEKNNNNIMTFVIIIFLLTLYSLSMNLLRQSVAITWFVYSYYLYKKQLYKKSIFCYLFAFLFHQSVLVGGLIFIVDWICVKLKKDRIIILCFFVLAMVGVVWGFESILEFLPNKYSYYANSDFNNSSFSVMSIIKKVLWIIPSCIYVKLIVNKKSEHYTNFLIITFSFIIDFILYFMSLKISNAGRLGYYFLYIGYFLAIPYLNQIFKEKKLVSFVIFCVLCVFWYNGTVVNYDVNRTYPYKSDLVEWLN